MNKRTLPGRPIRRQTLADRLAEEIADLVLAGELNPGDALPPEPRLAEQYGVSRAVVRDATHLLAARGLVDVRHGRGVFVTDSQREAFGDAMLLSLQRAGATAWDLEEFEQLVFPGVIALVCREASDEEIARLRAITTDYLEVCQAAIEGAQAGDETVHAGLERPFAHVLRAIYAASHNEVVRQIGEQLASLRRPRDWVGVSAREGLEMDREFLDELIAALESRDPNGARERAARLMTLPSEAVTSMKRTPIGQITRIDLETRPPA